MAVFQSLAQELSTPLLDDLHLSLWVVGKRVADHIDPVHINVMKGRKIVIAEDPDMHLTWRPDAIYLKPIPQCLLNEEIWRIFFNRGKPLAMKEVDTQLVRGIEAGHRAPDQEDGPSSAHTDDTTPNDIEADILLDSDVIPLVLGFLRSYSYLIRHPSDLRLAQVDGLVPKEWDWQRWSRFADPFRDLDDTKVAQRYQYGQLRLSRLNWAVRIYNPKNAKTRWFYQIPYWSIGQYLSHIIVPVGFIYVGLSIVLGAMQVVRAGNSSSSSTVPLAIDHPTAKAQHAFWIFGTIVLVAMGLVWGLFVTIPTIVLVWQLQFGYRHRQKKDDRSASTGV